MIIISLALCWELLQTKITQVIQVHKYQKIYTENMCMDKKCKWCTQKSRYLHLSANLQKNENFKFPHQIWCEKLKFPQINANAYDRKFNIFANYSHCECNIFSQNIAIAERCSFRSIRTCEYMRNFCLYAMRIYAKRSCFRMYSHIYALRKFKISCSDLFFKILG